jgi:hypothetical protein
MPDPSDWISLHTLDPDAPPPFAGPIEGLDRAGEPLDGDQDGVLDVLETPEPDAYGRLRVHDRDTGHALTVAAHLVGRGNYAVLNEPASRPITGRPILPEHHRFPVEPTPSGQMAENQEQQANG